MACHALDRLDKELLLRDVDLLRRVMPGVPGGLACRNPDARLKAVLAKMSHDIRTPMSGIIGMADLALSKSESPTARRHLEMIRQSAQSLLSVLNDTIDLVRMESGKLEIDSKSFRLREALAPTLEIADNLCREKGLSFTSHFDPSIPEHMLGDHRRLSQILNNLLNNAIKFTEKGRVEFSAHRADSPQERTVNGPGRVLIRFSVRDTGIGMPSSLQKSTRDILARDKPPQGCHGNGSGLHVARRLTHFLGGDIDFASLEKAGSTFRVTLPFSLADRQDERQAVARQPEKASGMGALSILLVEDNKVNQLFTKEMLLSEGHSVEVAENGREALDILARRRFDIVLMDIQMPIMDGMEATQRIRDAKSGVLDHDVPIVALTAHAIKGDRERFIKAGMTDYIAKPVDFRKLFGLMATIFPNRKIISGKAPRPSPAPVQPDQASRAIDPEWLEKMLTSRRDFLSRMFEVFVREEPLRLEKTEKALESGDMEILRFLAHSIKGATATMGAYGAKEHAAALEQAAKRQDLDDARRQFGLLAQEMSRVLDFMRGFLAEKDA